MKLLVITSIPTPYRVAFYNVLNQTLTEAGGKFKVLFCSKSEPNRHWQIDMDQLEFEYEILKGFHLNFKHLFVHFNPSILLKTEDFEPDIILYTGPWNMLSLIYSLTYSKVFKKKWKTLFWSEGHEESVLFKKGIIPVIRSWVLNRFDGFTIPNERSKSFLFEYLKLKKKPAFILPNTVDGDFYTKPIEWNDFDTIRVKTSYGIRPESRICIQIAQIEARKGVKELINYWHDLQQRIKENYILFLVGEGSLKAELYRFCKENRISDIIFTGNLAKEEVRELLFSSDFFILLTKYDPNPLTLIEASFAGLPIMTTRFAGNCSEIVFQEKNGVIIDKITFNEFHDAFIRLKDFAMDEQACKLSLNNANANFDIKTVVKELLEQLPEVL